MKKRWSLATLVITATALLDQYTKWLVIRRMALNESIPLIPGLFSLTHIKNRGGVFGFFRDQTENFRFLFFCILTIPVVAAVLLFMWKSRHERPIVFYSLALIVGGAIGNLIDRFRVGEVTDFLDVFIQHYHWPAFNVADMAISCGVGLILLAMIFFPEKRSDK